MLGSRNYTGLADVFVFDVMAVGGVVTGVLVHAEQILFIVDITVVIVAIVAVNWSEGVGEH